MARKVIIKVFFISHSFFFYSSEFVDPCYSTFKIDSLASDAFPLTAPFKMGNDFEVCVFALLFRLFRRIPPCMVIILIQRVRLYLL